MVIKCHSLAIAIFGIGLVVVSVLPLAWQECRSLLFYVIAQDHGDGLCILRHDCPICMQFMRSMAAKLVPET